MAVKVNRIDSFRWTIQNLPRNLQIQGAGIGGKEPITSPQFVHVEGHKWRALFTVDKELFLQLVEATHPITTEIR